MSARVETASQTPLVDSTRPAMSMAIDTAERDQRELAINKLNARIKANKLSEAFKARMSFATYKATHHVEQVPLSELEAKLPPPPPKRHSLDSNVSYAPRQATRQNLQPPPGSLYATLLDAPPAKRTRASSPPRMPQRSGAPHSPERRGPQTSPRVRTSLRKHPPVISPLNAREDEMKAAATLTSLMMSSHAQTQPNPLSRHSSDASSTASFAEASQMLPPKHLPAMTRAENAAATPPASPARRAPTAADPRTPRAKNDVEAAELMMFLATSPSPAQKQATKHKIPLTSGRVLFPNEPASGARGGDSQATLVDDEMDGSYSSSQASTVVDQRPSTPSAGYKPMLPPQGYPSPGHHQHRSTRMSLPSSSAMLAPPVNLKMQQR